MELVIVSGMSGAGKTVALKQYEDLGYYCIDNLPLALLGTRSSRLEKALKGRYDKIAVGVDARASAREIRAFPKFLNRFREGKHVVRVLFLTASDDTILHRYAETRRKHPLTGSGVTLEQAIASERRLLKPIADSADHVIDTTALNLHQLRDAIRMREPGAEHRLGVTLMSFGFKNGVPEGIDFLFDVRCLPNPHWEKTLRPLSGLDAPVVEYLEKHADVQSMYDDIRKFLETWLPRIAQQDVVYLTVAIGCTGGRHRSPYIVERLARHFRGSYDPLTVTHRELA